MTVDSSDPSGRSSPRQALALLLGVVVLVAGLVAASPAQAADGSISGVVRAPGGAAISDVTVTAYQYYDEEGVTGFDSYSSRQTGAAGEYSIQVPAGTYRLEFDGRASTRRSSGTTARRSKAPPTSTSTDPRPARTPSSRCCRQSRVS